MENRGLRWIGLGLGSPKTLFSAKKLGFLGYFWPFPIIWGFPLGQEKGQWGSAGLTQINPCLIVLDSKASLDISCQGPSF